MTGQVASLDGRPGVRRGHELGDPLVAEPEAIAEHPGVALAPALGWRRRGEEGEAR
jgi:hypothetical protein